MSIVSNQKLVYHARAQDDARRLADSLKNLPEAQRAGILAITAKLSETPVDIVMLGEPGDWREAWQAVSDHLPMTGDHHWHIGSGCHFVVEELAR